MHAERDNPDGVRQVIGAGRPTVREAESPGGRRKTREANAGGRKAAGNREPGAGSSAGGSRITGRIGAVAPAWKGADAGLVSLRSKAAETPEPKGKLDADDSMRGRDSDDGCHGERTGGRFP